MQFTLLTILFFSILGLLFNSTFITLKPAIPFLLMVIMFFMGITLSLNDFKRVLQQWKLILIGSGLQFLLMPLLAFLISKVFQLPSALTTGMLLVGVCPGGTASNVIVFLGKGNVPLSITLTLVSTLLSPLITPLLLDSYLGETIAFNLFQIMVSIAQIVILPISIGLLCNRYLSKLSQIIANYSSQLSSVGIALIIACVLALNKTTLAEFPVLIISTVALHNAFGFLGGYWATRIFTKDKKDCFTVSIEVGMQNSGLAVALAQQFFGTMTLATLPGAIFSFWHNLAGVTYCYFRKN